MSNATDRKAYAGSDHAPRVVDTTTEDGDTLYGRVWDDYSRFIAHATQSPEEIYGASRFSDDNYNRFNLGASWEDAQRLAVTGWDANRDRVTTLVDSIAESLGEVTRSEPLPYFDVSGGSVDVARFLDGEPECMLEYSMEDVAATGRVVRIGVQCNVSGATSTASIAGRGAILAALVGALRLAGLSPEIWTEWNSYGGPRDSKSVAYCVRVMEASQELDADRAMFALAHPSYVRRLTWSALDQDPEGDAFGAGSYYGMNGRRVMHSERLGIELDVTIEAPQGGHYPGEHDPEEYIRETLRGLGVTLGD